MAANQADRLGNDRFSPVLKTTAFQPEGLEFKSLELLGCIQNRNKKNEGLLLNAVNV